jgi:hypothetical protein
VKTDALRLEYRSLVITTCEWRTIGVSDPIELADQVFSALDRVGEPDLHDIYRHVDRVVLHAYQSYSDGLGVLQKLRDLGTPGPARPVRTMLNALSKLNTNDRALLQRRYWDELDVLELAESLRWPVERTVARLSRAEARFFAHARRGDPGLTQAGVPAVVTSLKPGQHTRSRRR